MGVIPLASLGLMPVGILGVMLGKCLGPGTLVDWCIYMLAICESGEGGGRRRRGRKTVVTKVLFIEVGLHICKAGSLVTALAGGRCTRA